MGRKSKYEVERNGLNRMQDRVFGIIFQAERNGVTDDEISMATGIAASTVVPRRGELVARGLVGAKAERRITIHGKPATVWVLKQFESKRPKKTCADDRKSKYPSKGELQQKLLEAYQERDALRHEIRLLKDAEAVRQSKHALKGLAALIKPKPLQDPIAP